MKKNLSLDICSKVRRISANRLLFSKFYLSTGDRQNVYFLGRSVSPASYTTLVC